MAWPRRTGRIYGSAFPVEGDAKVITVDATGQLHDISSGMRTFRPVIDTSKCVNCLRCFLVCPDGASYIHVMAPCPTGWGTASNVTVDLAREAMDCGLWYLAEYENGEFKLNRNPKEFASVENYIKSQSRFANLHEADMARITAERDASWERMRKNWVK